MNSMERTLKALSHQEPDRVPLFLLFSLYGAKESDMTVKKYFQDSNQVVKAQLHMKEKYQNDCFYTFSYAAAEVEAFGGEVLFVDEGTPVTGEPFLTSFDQITKLHLPDVKHTKSLSRVLDTTEALYKHANGEVPIIGVVMSPFSLPIMQIGFEKYLELLYFNREIWEELMKFNEEFCVSWANAQLEAGATAICYFDPMASPTMTDIDTYRKTGYQVALRTLPRIKGPTATHLASGTAFPVIDEIIQSGSALLGCSARDDIKELKEKSRNKISLLGNLNGLEMINWTFKQTQEEVKKVIKNAGSGGGLLLAENHGEIPFQVPEKVLLDIAKTVQEYGHYPINTED